MGSGAGVWHDSAYICRAQGRSGLKRETRHNNIFYVTRGRIEIKITRRRIFLIRPCPTFSTSCRPRVPLTMRPYFAPSSRTFATFINSFLCKKNCASSFMTNWWFYIEQCELVYWHYCKLRATWIRIRVRRCQWSLSVGGWALLQQQKLNEGRNNIWSLQATLQYLSTSQMSPVLKHCRAFQLLWIKSITPTPKSKLSLMFL